MQWDTALNNRQNCQSLILSPTHTHNIFFSYICYMCVYITYMCVYNILCVYIETGGSCVQHEAHVQGLPESLLFFEKLSLNLEILSSARLQGSACLRPTMVGSLGSPAGATTLDVLCASWKSKFAPSDWATFPAHIWIGSDEFECSPPLLSRLAEMC